MYNKLTIISDTAIYKDGDKYFAFGPVVREVESVDDLFVHITWIGYNRIDKFDDLSMLEVKSKNVKIILLKRNGGKDFFSKIRTIFLYPLIFFEILKNVSNADVVHTRAPSHPAFIGTIISFFLRNKIWWHKFAGSWNADILPFFYKFQRSILVKAKHSKVTINGFWNNQPAHCLSFENPCLTDHDIITGEEVIQAKKFNGKFILSFIGRLNESKGVDVILESLKQIDLNKVEKIHFIGDSNRRNHYELEANFLQGKAIFHGILSKEEVHLILAKSHFLLLPSKSEGFPKVIAEAACYGAIPIVSDVGSISHYVDDSNGFLWKRDSTVTYDKILTSAFDEAPIFLEKKAKQLLNLAKKFTFTNYILKLKSEILG